MKKISFFIPYLLTMAIVTILVGLVYVAVQQNYRSAADEPQLEIANDIYARLQRGASLDRYLSDSINLEQSLNVFATLYDAKGQPIESSGFLDGQYPQLPLGALDFSRLNGRNKVTWQPRRDVRMATVILPVNSKEVGFIAVGRSLKEIEMREHDLLMESFVAWLLAMGLTLMTATIHFIIRNK